MWSGCIVFLLVLLVAFGIEWVLLPQAAEPYRFQFSMALAFLVTLVTSNLWGLWHAVGRMRLASKDPSRWRDGERVAISGEIRPLRRGLQAPVSGVDAVAYEFQAIRRVTGSKNNADVVELHGYGMAACGIYSGTGMVRLLGFPKLQSFRHQDFDGGADRQRAAQYVAQRQWTQKAGSMGAAFQQLNGVYSATQDTTEEHFARAGCAIPAEIVPENQTPPQQYTREASPDSVARIYSALQSQAITLRETVIGAGSTVTAFGIYRTAQMGIEVSGSLLDVHCAVLPGPMGKVVGSLVWKALLTLLVMGALATAAHYVAWVRDGELLRSVVDFLGE